MNRKDRIRVLLMISSMRGGGSERQTLHLLNSLDRNLFEPQLYLQEAAGELLPSIPDDVKIHEDPTGRQPRGLHYPGKVLRRQSFSLEKYLRQQSIDVIYDRTYHMSMIAAPAASRLRVPRVSTIVSPPHHALPMVETKFIWLKRRRLAGAYRNAFRVLAVSQQAAHSAQHYYGLPQDKLLVIPNAVPEISFRGDFQIPTDGCANCIKLVCVGRMTTEKGHRDLLLALARHEQAHTEVTLHVHLLGDGPLRGEIERLASRLQRHRAFVHGYQARSGDWIAAADGLILPSLFEGMPNVVLEAMKLQTPVIATRAGGTVELEKEAPTIFWAQPGNVQSLTQAIEDFVMDEPRRLTQVNAASQMINKHHCITTTTHQIQSQLKAAVDQTKQCLEIQ